jgi:membrane protein implicated in regulation of membrane protease activity
MAQTFKEFWMNKTNVSRVIFILIIAYCVTCINLLLLVLGILPYIEWAQNKPNLFLWFAIGSFALTIIVSAYHLSTMLRRRKRKEDLAPASGK